MYFQSVRDVGLIYFSPRQWFYQIACKQLRSHLSTVKRPRGSLVSSSSFVSFSMSLLNLQVLKPVEIEVTIYQRFSLQLLQQKVLGYIEAEGLNSESSCTRPIIRDPNHISPRQAYINVPIDEIKEARNLKEIDDHLDMRLNLAKECPFTVVGSRTICMLLQTMYTQQIMIIQTKTYTLGSLKKLI